MPTTKCPAVSVIVPVYNVEAYLPECLDSLVSQTLANIEIICVDDGTPDRSGEIAASYAEKYSNFRLIRQENGGLSAARNTGLSIARGEYVCFLDSDDYLSSQALEMLYARASQEDLDVLYFDACPFFESEEVRQRNLNYVDYYTRKGDYSGIHTGQAMFARMRRNREFLSSVCLQLFRRSLIEDNQLRFYKGILHEDNLFTFQCAILSRRTGYLGQAFYQRRIHDDSIMTVSKSMRNVEGYLVSYTEMLCFLHGKQIETEAEEMISDYLYHSIFRNAFTAYQALPPQLQEGSLAHGDICAQQALFLLKRTAKIESDLKAQVYRYESGGGFSALKSQNILVRKLWGGIQCIQDHGLLYTVKLAGKKAWNLFRWADSRLQKLGLYRVLTWIPRITLHSLSLFRKEGFREGSRILAIESRMRRGAETPLVSFILTEYNVEPFLDQCLTTLRNQELKHIEIICVDDGSTDRSLEILHQYAAQDSRLLVLSQKNQFAGAARNLGLERARGEYVVFLDSDDFFHRSLAREAYFAAKTQEADVVVFGAKHYNNETQKYSDANWLLNPSMAPKQQPFSHRDCPTTLYRITTPCPWTKMFRREFILEKGLQFQKLQNSNDVFFTYSALAMADRIAVVDKVLVYYRVGLQTSLQATKQKNPFCFYEAYRALYQQLQAIGASEELLCSYVNVALSGCLHNLRTAKDPQAKARIFDALKTYIFADLGIAGRPDTDFYNREYREERNKILTLSFEEYQGS